MSFRKEIEELQKARAKSQEELQRKITEERLENLRQKNELELQRKIEISIHLNPIRSMVDNYMADLGDVTWGAGVYSRRFKVDKDVYLTYLTAAGYFVGDRLAEWVIERYRVSRLGFLSTSRKFSWVASRRKGEDWDTREYYVLSVHLDGDSAYYVARGRTSDTSEKSLSILLKDEFAKGCLSERI